MTRAVPIHRGWLGSFSVRAHASGPKGHSFCWVNVRAKRPVPTSRTYLAILWGGYRVKRQYPSERKNLRG